MLKIPAYQLLTGEESIANTACTETFLAQQFIQNGYTLSYWSSGNQADSSCPLEQLKQMYLLSTEDFKSKEHYQIVPVYAAFCI